MSNHFYKQKKIDESNDHLIQTKNRRYEALEDERKHIVRTIKPYNTTTQPNLNDLTKIRSAEVKPLDNTLKQVPHVIQGSGVQAKQMLPNSITPKYIKMDSYPIGKSQDLDLFTNEKCFNKKFDDQKGVVKDGEYFRIKGKVVEVDTHQFPENYPIVPKRVISEDDDPPAPVPRNNEVVKVGDHNYKGNYNFEKLSYQIGSRIGNALDDDFQHGYGKFKKREEFRGYRIPKDIYKDISGTQNLIATERYRADKSGNPLSKKREVELNNVENNLKKSINTNVTYSKTNGGKPITIKVKTIMEYGKNNILHGNPPMENFETKLTPKLNNSISKKEKPYKSINKQKEKPFGIIDWKDNSIGILNIKKPKPLKRDSTNIFNIDLFGRKKVKRGMF